MSFGRNNSPDGQVSCLIHSFDFAAVKSVMGLDKQDVMAMVNNYDDYMDENQASGLLDFSFLLAEAICGVVSEIKYDGSHQQIVSTDYFAMLYDMLSNEEDQFENLDDIVCTVSRHCLKIHSALVVGFTAQLEYDERSYLASILSHGMSNPSDDPDFKVAELTDETIILTCTIPRELDEDEDSIQRLHSNIVARINSALSRDSRRG